MALILKPREHDGPDIADGIYAATLIDVSKYTNTFGPRVGFRFRFDDGRELTKSTAQALSIKGQLVQVLQGLMGRPVTDAEIAAGVDVAALVGSRCHLLVVKAQNRDRVWFPNIEKVLPLK
jgi:hypothetical protein